MDAPKYHGIAFRLSRPLSHQNHGIAFRFVTPALKNSRPVSVGNCSAYHGMTFRFRLLPDLKNHGIAFRMIGHTLNNSRHRFIADALFFLLAAIQNHGIAFRYCLRSVLRNHGIAFRVWPLGRLRAGFTAWHSGLHGIAFRFHGMGFQNHGMAFQHTLASRCFCGFYSAFFRLNLFNLV